VGELGFIHAFFRDGDHGIIQRHGVKIGRHAVQFEKQECRSHAGTFIAVKTSLGLGDVKSVGGGDIEQVAVAVIVGVPGLSDGALKEFGTRMPGAPPNREMDFW
jgi:hypothetical protein